MKHEATFAIITVAMISSRITITSINCLISFVAITTKCQSITIFGFNPIRRKVELFARIRVGGKLVTADFLIAPRTRPISASYPIHRVMQPLTVWTDPFAADFALLYNAATRVFA